MSEQISFVPLAKYAAKAAAIRQVLDHVNLLADWYRHYKPEVTRIYVFPADYRAIEAAVGTRGITLRADGIFYRGFRIEAQA